MTRALFIFTVTNGKPDFGSDFNEARFRQFLKEKEGEKFGIIPEDKIVSDEMRGYMFGAVIPFLRQISPQSWPASDDQVYEMLKKEFNYFEAIDPVTKRKERYGQSVMSKSCKSKKATEFIARIGEWVAEQYSQELPDSKEYLAWKDSAPLIGEKYDN